MITQIPGAYHGCLAFALLSNFEMLHKEGVDT